MRKSRSSRKAVVHGALTINSAIGQLSTTTQHNASSSEQLAATAEELSGQAEQLQQTMAFFRLSAHGASAVRSAPPRRAAAVAKRPAARPAPARVGNSAAAASLLDEADFTKF